MPSQQAKSLAVAAWCVSKRYLSGLDSRLTTPVAASVFEIRFANPEAGT